MPSTLQFGPIEIQPRQRVVLLNGQAQSLGGRAFDLLLALAERADRVVTKDELFDAVWGRVIVEDANLHVHVSALRKLLGADVIQTIPGRGYRFIAPLGAVAAPPPVTAPVADAASRGPVLFGRERDLASLNALMADERLVTLVGPGGIGKTRLARALLAAQRERHADGVVQVELAALTDAALIPGAIASALQLPLAGSGDALTAVAAAMRSQRLLVLLDNAEHLIDGVATVAAALLASGAAVHLLVTSQVPLKLEDERVYRLSGLEVPALDEVDMSTERALACGAIGLFNQRVQAADRHFRLTEANVGHAISICRQLDGIALAIELAAARCPLLGLAMVAQRLDERFSLLRAGSRTAPTRHQTLQAAMDWSHALLTPDQQRALRRLGVFSGGFTMALAQQVLRGDAIDEWAAIDLLADLVDRSLVSMDSATDEQLTSSSDESNPSPRYRLLETGRAFALAKLDQAGESDALRRRHAQALQALFEQAAIDCWQMPEAAFVARYEAELDNLRAALDWAVAHEPALAVALTGGAARLWRGLSMHPEALARCRQAAALIDDRTPPEWAARLWEALAQLSGEISSSESRSAAERAVRAFEALGDRRGLYLALAHLAFSYRTDTPPARAAFERMQQLEDPAWPAALLLFGAKVEGGLASTAQGVDAARAANQRRLALATEIGSDRDIFAALGNLADLALIGGDAPEAVRLGRDLLLRLTRRHRVTRMIALGNLLLALLANDELAAARATATEFVELTRTLDFMYLSGSTDALALLAALEGRAEAAAQLMGFADAAYVQDQQQREANEAHARQRCAALLRAQTAPPLDLPALQARGAGLSSAAVCLLALG